MTKHRINPNSLKNLALGRKGRRKKPDCIVEIARHLITEKIPGQPITWEEAIARALVQQASSGNLPAIKELLDRLYGKSVQPLSGMGEGGAIPIRIIEVIRAT